MALLGSGRSGHTRLETLVASAATVTIATFFRLSVSPVVWQGPQKKLEIAFVLKNVQVGADDTDRAF
jgi:hypothetical protein